MLFGADAADDVAFQANLQIVKRVDHEINLIRLGGVVIRAAQRQIPFQRVNIQLRRIIRHRHQMARDEDVNNHQQRQRREKNLHGTREQNGNRIFPEPPVAWLQADDDFQEAKRIAFFAAAFDKKIFEREFAHNVGGNGRIAFAERANGSLLIDFDQRNPLQFEQALHLQAQLPLIHVKQGARQ